MQSELSYTRVGEVLEALRMTSALSARDNVLEAAQVDDLPPFDVLGRLLEIELHARHDRRVEANLELAGLLYSERLDDSGFDAQPSVDPNLIHRPPCSTPPSPSTSKVRATGSANTAMSGLRLGIYHSKEVT